MMWTPMLFHDTLALANFPRSLLRFLREALNFFPFSDMRFRVCASGFWVQAPDGRGQPLSFTLSFGEIPWFDKKGEIRRCDWSENAFLCMCLV
jgi:hypothetical protein